MTTTFMENVAAEAAVERREHEYRLTYDSPIGSQTIFASGPTEAVALMLAKGYPNPQTITDLTVMRNWSNGIDRPARPQGLMYTDAPGAFDEYAPRFIVKELTQ